MIPTGSDQMPHIPPIPILGFGGAVYIAAIVALIAYNGFHTLALVGMYSDLLVHPKVRPLPLAAAPTLQP